MTTHQRPSSESKLRRHAWAANPPRTPLWEITALPRPSSSIKGHTSKGEGMERREGKGRGSGTPTFWEKVKPLHCPHDIYHQRRRARPQLPQHAPHRACIIHQLIINRTRRINRNARINHTQNTNTTKTAAAFSAKKSDSRP